MGGCKTASLVNGSDISRLEQQLIGLRASRRISAEECLDVALKARRQVRKGKPPAESRQREIDQQVFPPPSGHRFLALRVRDTLNRRYCASR
jgi:hypothetical protein